MADTINEGKYEADDHFGWCPECGRSDGYVNIGRTHVFFCDAHRTRWDIGSNLFSSWRYEDEATWQRNAEHVGPYRDVDSHTPTPAMLEEALNAAPQVTVPRQKPYRSKQDYATPANFIAAVKARLGIPAFAFDFAASATNAKAPLFLDRAADALQVEHWERLIEDDGWGWLNPPYTDIGPWAAKCRATGEADGQVAFLVPASVGSNWFRDHVDGHAQILLLNGRLAFMPDKPTWLYPKDCLLALYGPRVTPGYEVWDWRPDKCPKVVRTCPVGLLTG